tara:strand:- start:2223 stop:2570 length:348 start_codon:yes stop_codon:yes gene_type:complete
METLNNVTQTTYTAQEMGNMRNIIENMNKFNQIEVLRILQNGQITLNENKYGVFVNLSNLNYANLNKLSDYINYVETQEKNLSNVENQKKDYINAYFSNDIKDIVTNNVYSNLNA